MPRIALIGAGGQVFATTLIGDVLAYPELSDSELALMDVDPDRLEPTRRAAESMIAKEGLDATVERSEEYGARLIHSLATDTERRLNLDVPNADGAIANLPNDSCVEVPCAVDGAGVHPCTVGDLPPQLAALCRSNVAVQERAVTGALENDREAVSRPSNWTRSRPPRVRSRRSTRWWRNSSPRTPSGCRSCTDVLDLLCEDRTVADLSAHVPVVCRACVLDEFYRGIIRVDPPELEYNY